MAAKAGQQMIEVGAGEHPVKRRGRGVVVLLEGEDLDGEGIQAGEVVRGEQLALEDGEPPLD
jgi:hypothetical protein